MNALVLDPELKLAAAWPKPQALAGEALLKIRLAGICNTDLEMVRSYYPFRGVLGHEFVGEVLQADEAGWLGARVVSDINLGCGDCEACRAGNEHHCRRRRTLGMRAKDGVFAEYATLPLRNLYRVPDHLSDEQAVFCEPLAAALEIVEQVPITPQQRVFLMGAGKLGLLVAQVLARTGCQLRVAVRHTRRADLLACWGILAVAVEDVPPGWADVGVDCTGSPAGFDPLRERVRAQGTLVLKSTFAGPAVINLSSLVVDEQTLVGSRCGPFSTALQVLSEGSVDVFPLIEARYPLREGVAAMHHAAQPGTLKVLLVND